MEILGIEYEITQFENNARNDAAMGRGDSKTATIHLCKDMNDQVKRSTLLHEIIHQISDKLGLDLNEAQVCGLETGLFPFFTDLRVKVKNND